MIEQVHGVDTMSSYKFIERVIVTPLSNDMFITGADLAAMLDKLEQSSELERFSKGSQVGFLEFGELADVTTLEDTSQLDPTWHTAWYGGLARLADIPTTQRSNAGNWSLEVEGVFVEEAAPPRISWNTSQLDMDEIMDEWSTRTMASYISNPWLYIDDNSEIEPRQFSGEIVVEQFLDGMHGNRFRVSFTYFMQGISRYNGLDLKEYYHFYFKLKSLPTLNYPKGEVFS